MSLQQVEANRIAALLKVPATELSFLQDCAPAELTRLRKRITAAGIERHRRSFERLSRASGLMPVPIAARIAQDVLGPEIVAQLTPYMPVERSVKVAQQMSIGFQADVSVHMVPQASSDLLAALPHELRRAVTRELLARGEYAVMGTVVDFLPEPVIADLAQEIEDPEALLETTGYVEDKSRLGRVVSNFSDERIDELLRSAAQGGRMAVLCELVAAIGDAPRRRLAPILASADPAVQAEWRKVWSELKLGRDPLLE
ncbi:hypothetical protein RM530_00360 [Algiphilus sp. W345]|uniref:DUF2336 domain-containing protein n=1 Tax=Banduia mediterranea TaxID=3075609 RepID=A0ABU2WD63_9GAMM|nr:hypothetical protein [Algiphilus sp. W345]MDT0495821.1 hypothetical protein [Algiphilus sp. W345]